MMIGIGMPMSQSKIERIDASKGVRVAVIACSAGRELNAALDGKFQRDRASVPGLRRPD